MTRIYVDCFNSKRSVATLSQGESGSFVGSNSSLAGGVFLRHAEQDWIKVSMSLVIPGHHTELDALNLHRTIP